MDAGDSNGFSISSDTCYAYNRLDDSGSCHDAGADHTYRVYLRAGERMAGTLTAPGPCPPRVEWLPFPSPGLSRPGPAALPANHSRLVMVAGSHESRV